MPIPLRYQELARQAVARMQSLSGDPVESVCWAIERAIDEHLGSVDLPSLPLRCRGMRRVALWLSHHGRGTPSTIASALHTDPRVISRTLKRLQTARICSKSGRVWTLVSSASPAITPSP